MGGRVLCGYCVFPTGVGAARATAQTYQKQDAPDAWPLKTWLLNHLITSSKLDHDSARQTSYKTSLIDDLSIHEH